MGTFRMGLLFLFLVICKARVYGKLYDISLIGSQLIPDSSEINNAFYSFLSAHYFIERVVALQ